MKAVIAPVSIQVKNLTGRNKIKALSACARKALDTCIHLSDFPPIRYLKDHRGAPLPQQGIFWSVSHKNSYVAAVCALSPAGIDIEEILPRSEGIFDIVASDTEWKVFSERSWENFFRVFTAKEAVVKTSGEGIKDLKKCVVLSASSTTCSVSYKNRIWCVVHHFFDNHIVSVTHTECEFVFTEAFEISEGTWDTEYLTEK